MIQETSRPTVLTTASSNDQLCHGDKIAPRNHLEGEKMDSAYSFSQWSLSSIALDLCCSSKLYRMISCGVEL